MDTINVIDAKLDEIANQIKRESINIKLTRKQCELMAKNLAKGRKRKKTVDAVAAVLILESYLALRKNKN